MNPDLQKQLAEMLAKLTDVASDAASFAKEQIPPLVQEKIALGRAEETVMFAIYVSIALVALVLSLRYWKRAWQLTLEWDAPVILANLIGLMVSGLTLTAKLHEFLLVWFAPRLYIVEWLKSMVTKS